MAQPLENPSPAMGSSEAFHATWQTRIDSAREAVETAKAKGEGFEAQVANAEKYLAEVQEGYDARADKQDGAVSETPETIQ